jgi:hypothetical protein
VAAISGFRAGAGTPNSTFTRTGLMNGQPCLSSPPTFTSGPEVQRVSRADGTSVAPAIGRTASVAAQGDPSNSRLGRPSAPAVRAGAVRGAAGQSGHLVEKTCLASPTAIALSRTRHISADSAGPTSAPASTLFPRPFPVMFADPTKPLRPSATTIFRCSRTPSADVVYMRSQMVKLGVALKLGVKSAGQRG